MIKVAAPRMALKVVDEAIQVRGWPPPPPRCHVPEVHSAHGMSQVSELPGMCTVLRTLRVADGPDIVHMNTIVKEELKETVNPLAKELSGHKGSPTSRSTTRPCCRTATTTTGCRRRRSPSCRWPRSRPHRPLRGPCITVWHEASKRALIPLFFAGLRPTALSLSNEETLQYSRGLITTWCSSCHARVRSLSRARRRLLTLTAWPRPWPPRPWPPPGPRAAAPPCRRRTAAPARALGPTCHRPAARAPTARRPCGRPRGRPSR